MKIICTILFFPFFCPLTFAADLNPPVPITAVKTDRTRLSGRVTHYDDHAFTLIDRDNDTLTVPWNDLDPANIYSVHEHLWGKGTADEWLSLGKSLLNERNGSVPANKSFARALRLNPSLKEKIDAIKRGEDDQTPATNPSATDNNSIDRTAPAPTTASSWETLSPTEQTQAVQQLKDYIAQVRQDLDPNLQLYETKYFLFASDLQSSEARRWAAVLDRMYARLSDLFAVPKDTNIWRGKALVLVFAQRNTYNTFEQKYFHNDASNTGGTCHGAPNGDVKIAFYRASDDQWFSHVLVHESTHGFLHRYRSPVHVPSWANEGLAEFVAYDLLPQPGVIQATKNAARADLEANKNLSDFFSGNAIPNHRYSVAFTLTDYLIETNKKAYINFINAIKDSAPAEDALQESFHLTIPQLAQKFATAMGIHDLTAQ